MRVQNNDTCVIIFNVHALIFVDSLSHKINCHRKFPNLW